MSLLALRFRVDRSRAVPNSLRDQSDHFEASTRPLRLLCSMIIGYVLESLSTGISDGVQLPRTILVSGAYS